MSRSTFTILHRAEKLSVPPGRAAALSGVLSAAMRGHFQESDQFRIGPEFGRAAVRALVEFLRVGPGSVRVPIETLSPKSVTGPFAGVPGVVPEIASLVAGAASGPSELGDLLRLADYMDAPVLLDHLCAYIAHHLRNRDVYAGGLRRLVVATKKRKWTQTGGDTALAEALVRASRGGRTAEVRSLLERGAAVLDPARGYPAALWESCLPASGPPLPEMVSLLLEAGSDPNAQHGPSTLLHRVWAQKQAGVVEVAGLLGRHGARFSPGETVAMLGPGRDGHYVSEEVGAAVQYGSFEGVGARSLLGLVEWGVGGRLPPGARFALVRALLEIATVRRCNLLGAQDPRRRSVLMLALSAPDCTYSTICLLRDHGFALTDSEWDPARANTGAMMRLRASILWRVEEAGLCPLLLSLPDSVRDRVGYFEDAETQRRLCAPHEDADADAEDMDLEALAADFR